MVEVDETIPAEFTIKIKQMNGNLFTITVPREVSFFVYTNF